MPSAALHVYAQLDASSRRSYHKLLVQCTVIPDKGRVGGAPLPLPPPLPLNGLVFSGHWNAFGPLMWLSLQPFPPDWFELWGKHWMYMYMYVGTKLVVHVLLVLPGAHELPRAAKERATHEYSRVPCKYKYWERSSSNDFYIWKAGARWLRTWRRKTDITQVYGTICIYKALELHAPSPASAAHALLVLLIDVLRQYSGMGSNPKFTVRSLVPVEGSLRMMLLCQYVHRSPCLPCCRSRFMRKIDRERNGMNFPRLHYPELYLLLGGYKAFYEKHPVSWTQRIGSLTSPHHWLWVVHGFTVGRRLFQNLISINLYW